MTRLGSLLQTLLHRRDFEDDMSEEVRFHLEQYADDLVRSGLSLEEAARRARIELGSVDNVKADCREALGLRLLDEIGQDVRHAARRLRRSPGFTATALGTLGLCLGATVAIFAVVDSVLLRPLPFPAPDRLVRIFNTYPQAGVLDDGASVANYYERRGSLPALTALAVYRDGTAIVGDAGSTAREPVARVTPDFFATLGLGPVLGRSFSEEETTPRRDHVAVLTDAAWRRWFDRDPGVVGRAMRVDGVDTTVVGVLPPEMSFLSSKARIYLPLSSPPEARTLRQRHSGSNSHMVARLAPGATPAQAQAQLDAHNAAVQPDDPEATMMAAAGFRSVVVPLHADHVASIRPTLLLLQAGVLFLLLIGGVNVANLLLIRATARTKELAVRQALGASARHVVTEVMAETMLLTTIGGGLGLALGAAGIRLLDALGAEQLPLGARIAFDARVALAAIGAAVALGLALGVPIVWYHLRGHSQAALRAEPRGATPGRAVQHLRHGFLVLQMALAFVLLAGAGLLGLSLERVLSVSPGFRAENVSSGHLSLPATSYPDEASLLGFADRLTRDLRGQPGVLAAGVVTNVPLSGNTIKSAVNAGGHVLAKGESLRGHYSYGVSGDYFAALGVPLREGRFVDAGDSRRGERVCVVDEDFARRYWPGGGAVGHRVFRGADTGRAEDAFTVVGVVGAVKQAGLTEEEAQGAVYFPLAHRLDRSLFVVTRGSAPAQAAGPLQAVVRRIDPELPVDDVRSMEGRIADSLVARRSPALLAGLFSSVALLLTAIGTYGVLSYAVAQRRREIALRMALGARPEQVRAQFLALALRLLAAGTVLGLAGAWMTGRAMQALLFQVPALQSTILATTAAVMAAVSLAACLAPSRRAARISPMEVLAEQ